MNSSARIALGWRRNALLASTMRLVMFTPVALEALSLWSGNGSSNVYVSVQYLS